MDAYEYVLNATYMYIHTYIHTYMYMYVYIYVCVRACIYIYIYIRILWDWQAQFLEIQKAGAAVKGRKPDLNSRCVCLSLSVCLAG